jgi:hypothetical protein
MGLLFSFRTTPSTARAFSKGGSCAAADIGKSKREIINTRTIRFSLLA